MMKIIEKNQRRGIITLPVKLIMLLLILLPVSSHAFANEKLEAKETEKDAQQEQPLKSSSYQNPQERKQLFGNLKSATSENDARLAEEKIWRFWMRGPNEDVTDRLAKAMERRRTYDYAGALEILNKMIMETPDWAEVWNQRAFVYFLREEFDKSLEDTDKAIELEPKHFGALAGKARILMGQGRMQIGQKTLRDAVEIHPFLRERSMLIEIPGQEL